MTHGVSCGPQLLHVPTGGVQTPLVQAIEKVCLLPLDGRDIEGARQAQSTHHQAAGFDFVGT
jgi:hypothetical protein